MKTLEEIKCSIAEHIELLKEKYTVKEIGIFGSYVRGEHKKGSNIDIIVDFEEPLSLPHIVSIENYISDILKTKIDVASKKNIRQELKEAILKEAIPI